MEDLAVRKNFVFYLIIVVIFMTWKRIEVGGILKLSNGGQANKGWGHFMGEVDPSRHYVKILIWEL